MSPRLAPERRVFANRTLNLRSVRAIGYDMDYTLVHYDVDAWEEAAFRHAQGRLAERGWPVADLAFDRSAFSLGLTFDLELGNLLKATRFGYVVRAQHGLEILPFAEQRRAYFEPVVNLRAERFRFMNTLFELSRASLFSQLVALHDRRALPGVRSYAELYRAVGDALDLSHTEGALKREITEDPGRFVAPDPELVPTLLDQRAARKKLLLITNSGWAYTRFMMAYTLDPHCPAGTTWRDLFDVVIVSAQKPRFFSGAHPLHVIVDEEQGLMRPHAGPLERGQIYYGGSARHVEETLGLSRAQLLYVGDHLFGDVHVSKDVRRWRTALISRELEDEIRDASAFAPQQARLEALMGDKVELERRQARLRLERRRKVGGRKREQELEEVAGALEALDEQISPLAVAAGALGSGVWGPLMRAGIDKSLYARQVEKYADVYTSRVSNLGAETPYAYLRAARGSLPHDEA